MIQGYFTGTVVEGKCRYCNGEIRLFKNSSVLYKGNTDYGPRYACVDEHGIGCDAHVGCHPGTVIPLGSLANGELRRARNALHEAFDRLWKSGFWTRNRSYEWLASALNIKPEDCHIGLFEIERCRLAYKHVKSINMNGYLGKER